MKTAILTLAIFFATVFGISQSTYAASSSNHEVSTLLTNVTSISQIEVYGNVQLYLSTGTTDQVKVYNNYYAENALVQDQNGILRITSYNTEKLVVWVTVKDLAKLSAYDNAEVRSFGKLSAIDLDVTLYNQAAAKLDIDAFAAAITLNDHAQADVTGSVTESSLQYAQSSLLNTAGLVSKAAKTVKSDKMHCACGTAFASL